VTLVELTMPLDWEWMPDEAFPVATHFLLPPKSHPAKGMTLSGTTGTHIDLPARFIDFRKSVRIHEIPPERLTLRDTVVVPLPCEADTVIDAAAIDAALKGSGLGTGDALLLATGWGDNLDRMRGSDRYQVHSPSLSVDGAKRLGERMAEAASDLLLLDTAVVGMPSRHIVPQWANLLPRPRPWPSEPAWVYLSAYTCDRVAEDFAADHALAAAGVMVVSRLVNCGALPAGRAQVIVAPLNQVRGVSATCRVVAVN
jgi:kynurenine formamidase